MKSPGFIPDYELTLGEVVHRLQLESGWTIADLAHTLRLTTHQANMLLANRIHPVSMHLAYQLQVVFGFDVNDWANFVD